MPKSLLVVEGGAMRGIFTTGVLDAFIDEDYYPFDHCVGVSSGANNLASYLAKMHRRNYMVYTEYSTNRRFVNILNPLRGREIMDLDWLWDETISAIKLDIDTITSSRSSFTIGLTDEKTGKPVTITPDTDNLENLLKASSAIPYIYNKPVTVNDNTYFDGGISRPIPISIDDINHYDTVVVLRTRPKDFVMKPYKGLMKSFLEHEQTPIKKSILQRADIYNATLRMIRNYPDKVIEVCPSDTFKTKRFTKDLCTLNQDYLLGVQAGKDLMVKLKNRR